MWGINLYTGGHFDDYRVSYTHFNSHSIPDDVFAFDPSNCTVGGTFCFMNSCFLTLRFMNSCFLTWRFINSCFLTSLFTIAVV